MQSHESFKGFLNKFFSNSQFTFPAKSGLSKLPSSSLILESMFSPAHSSHAQIEEGEQQTQSAPSSAANEDNEKANNAPNAADLILVDWEPNDKHDPRKWSVGFKVWCTFQLSMLAVAASLGTSIIAPGDAAIAKYTGISSEVSVLSVSLYM